MESGKEIKYTEIEGLLEKYFDGATTLDEERTLREFFTGGAILPPELEYAAAMFGHFADAAADTGAPAGHPADRVREGITEMESEAPARRKRSLVPYLAGVVSAAAVLALVLMLSNSRRDLAAYEHTVYCYVNGEPVTDPDLALEYSRMAFTRLSDAMPDRQAQRQVRATFEKLGYITDLAGIMESSEE